MLSEPVIKRITLSRYLFELALQNVRSQQETGDAACVNLLQDATELFLLAALDHLNAPTKPKTEFSQYLDKLSEALDWPLPYRRRIVEINKVRVAAKHDGISPNRTEVDGYVADSRKFLEEVCQKALGADFWTVSLVDLLEAGETKGFLQAAELAHNQGRYGDCLIECRKAFFVAFEKDYDTQTDLKNALPIFGSKAPYYARDKDEIRKRVKDHFDYVVFDHTQVDRDLMKEGIDHTGFWNVWRLTPMVYRHDKADPWRIKREPKLLNSEDIKERSALVLSTMISILLARQATKMAARYVPAAGFSTVKAKPGTKFFAKADKTGDLAGELPDGQDAILIDYATEGLNDDDWYWRAMWMKDGNPQNSYIFGYVLQGDIIFSG
jgi:hypothetical protein